MLHDVRVLCITICPSSCAVKCLSHRPHFFAGSQRQVKQSVPLRHLERRGLNKIKPYMSVSECANLLVLFKNWTLVLDSVKRVHCSLVPLIPWFTDSYVRKRLLNRKGWSFHLEGLSWILPYSTEHLSTFQGSELLGHIKSTGKGVNSQRLLYFFHHLPCHLMWNRSLWIQFPDAPVAASTSASDEFRSTTYTAKVKTDE